MVMSTVADAAGPNAPSLTFRFLFECTFAQLHFRRPLPDNSRHPNRFLSKSCHCPFQEPKSQGLRSTYFKLTRTVRNRARMFLASKETEPVTSKTSAPICFCLQWSPLMRLQSHLLSVPLPTSSRHAHLLLLYLLFSPGQLDNSPHISPCCRCNNL